MSQGGFSLVELTIATALFSLGLGSLSLLFLLSVQGAFEARLQTLAVSQANTMSEMMLLAPDGRDRMLHPSSDSGIDCGHPNTCTPEQIADSFMESWQGQLENTLPNGGGSVCRDSTPYDGSARDMACDGMGGLLVKVAWEGSTAAGAEPDVHRVVNRLPLP